MLFVAQDWPTGSLKMERDVDHLYDPADDESFVGEKPVGAPKDSINTFGSPKELQMFLEVKGEGQQRHWMRNKLGLCCTRGLRRCVAKSLEFALIVVQSLPPQQTLHSV